MDLLRIILIVVGILLIAAIYLAEPLKARFLRWREARAQQHDPLDSDEVLGLQRGPEHELPDEWVGEAYFVRRDDTLSADALNELKGMGKDHGPLDDDLSLSTRDDEEGAAESAPSMAEEVIVLTLMAPQGKVLRGPLLLKALQDAGLAHGEMNIFHYTPEGQRRALFSIANILEPGHFVLSEMVQMETPGLAIFMQLPACLDGDVAWLHLRNRAEQLAEALNATLCDAQRRPMDEEGLLLLQHQAASFKAI